MNLPEDKPLQNALKQWQVSTPVPPRLREAVWRKIARAEPQPAPTFAGWWKAWLAATFAKPALAAGYVAVLLAAGLTAGYLHGEARLHRTNDELAARYVHSLDPYQQTSQ
jgi:hypothetical protein